MKTKSTRYTFLFIISIFFGTICVSGQNDGIITIESNEKIKHIIAKKKAYNKNLKKIKGFKIQLFNGSENGAYSTRDEFLTQFPEADIEIMFSSPEWKVWVGSYRSQLEADRALKEIKEAQFNAFVFTTEIKI